MSSINKICLTSTSKEDFMNYALQRRKNGQDRNYNMYLTDSILSKVYDFFAKHRLTVESNAKSYWYKNGKAEFICLGYSGHSINERDDESGIIDNLFHEVWCKAEWLARSNRDTFYQDTVKAYFGNAYNTLTA